MPAICVTEPKSTSLIASNKSYMAYMPAVLVAAGIAVLSLVEKAHAPAMPMGDKWSHGIAYCVLSLCLMAALWFNSRTRWHWWLTAVLSCTAYGLLMEVLQRFCTLTRSGEMADLLADFLGALVGVAMVAIFCLVRHLVISSSRHLEK